MSATWTGAARTRPDSLTALCRAPRAVRTAQEGNNARSRQVRGLNRIRVLSGSKRVCGPFFQR